MKPLVPALAALALLAGGCSRPGVARPGSEVAVEYTLFCDGEIYDSSVGSEPLVFHLGAGEVPPVFETAVLGLKAGQSRTVEAGPEQAYGARDASLIESKPRRAFEGLGELKPGALVLGARGGKPAQALIVAVDSATVTLDFNHRLAGRPVRLTARLVSTRTR